MDDDHSASGADPLADLVLDRLASRGVRARIGHVDADGRPTTVIVPSWRATIDLGRLLTTDAAGNGTDDRAALNQAIDRRLDELASASDAVCRLDLDRWDVVADRLMLRLVPRHHPGPKLFTGNRVAMGVAVATSEGTMLPSRSQLDRWGQPRHRLLTVAGTNTGAGGGPSATPVVARWSERRILLTVLGDPAVTGLLADRAHWSRWAAVLDRERATVGLRSRHLLAVAPDTSTILIAEGAGPTADQGRTGGARRGGDGLGDVGEDRRVASDLAALAERMRRRSDRPLPIEVWRFGWTESGCGLSPAPVLE